MAPRVYLDGRVAVHAGDCLEVLKTIADNSIDSVCTDPPYCLTSIRKRFGKDGSAPCKQGKDGSFARLSGGFMNKLWDDDIAFQSDLWAEMLRVLKPGGHMFAFGGDRTYHRMACAIEDADFEIRRMFLWIYGSGFPKSHDVSKAIDKAAGVERAVVGVNGYASRRPQKEYDHRQKWGSTLGGSDTAIITAPSTDAAKQWDGWGTDVKPALEPICLARKPLSEKTVAANVLRWGTGALNIDGCRVGAGEDKKAKWKSYNPNARHEGWARPWMDGRSLETSHDGQGRWPSNLIHDGSPEVLAGFPDTKSGKLKSNHVHRTKVSTYGTPTQGSSQLEYGNDSGSAARFFYCAKASKADRCGSKHPTVKPIKLLQHLCRLITPPGGTILDCFAGSGTTAEAAYREGFNAILIEREEEYLADIERRMSGVPNRAMTSKYESAKAQKDVDATPLLDLLDSKTISELAKLAIDTQSDITVKLVGNV